MHRNFQVSKQTEDKVKLAKQYIESRYKEILYREEQQRVGWQKIIKALAQASLPESEKKHVAQKALTREASNTRLMRVKQRLEDYELLEMIGKGAFGEVRLARCKATGEIVAIKRMAKSKLAGKKQVASVFLERQCLSRGRSRWLVQLKAAFQDRDYLYIAMEWVPGGDLLRLLIDKDIFSQEQTRFYIGELIVAIDEMHRMHYIHRDIKPDNILINADGHLKLTDFGLSKELQPYKPRTKQSPKKDLGREPRPSLKKYEQRRKRQFSKVGTPDYIAPQVLTDSSYDHRVDIWSVGVIMFECLFGYPPFSHEDSREVCQRVINWEDNLSFPDSPKISLEAKLLILGMLSPREHRLTIPQIKLHPFFANFHWDRLADMPAPFRPDLKHELDTKNFDTFEEETPWLHPERPSERQSHIRRSSSVGYQYNFAGFDWQPQPKVTPFQETLKQIQMLQTKKSFHPVSLKKIKTQQPMNMTTNVLKSRENLKFRNSVKVAHQKSKQADRNPALRKVGLKAKHLKTEN